MKFKCHLLGGEIEIRFQERDSRVKGKKEGNKGREGEGKGGSRARREGKGEGRKREE